MSKSVYNLIYTSTPSVRFSQQNLVELLTQSRKYNSEHEITGLLLFAGGKFMQLLEGSKAKVDDLMLRITKDTRHRDANISEQGYVPQRQFSNWSMAFLDFSSPQVRQLPGYNPFLELPTEASDLLGSNSRSMLLLHYFKSVMSASNDAILNMAETIKARKTETVMPSVSDEAV